MRIIFETSLEKVHRQNIRFMTKSGKAQMKADGFHYIVTKGSKECNIHVTIVTIVKAGTEAESDTMSTRVVYAL